MTTNATTSEAHDYHCCYCRYCKALAAEMPTQVDLPADAAKALRDNAWNLYDSQQQGVSEGAALALEAAGAKDLRGRLVTACQRREAHCRQDGYEVKEWCHGCLLSAYLATVTPSREQLIAAFKAGHYAWPTAHEPTLQARAEAYVKAESASGEPSPARAAVLAEAERLLKAIEPADWEPDHDWRKDGADQVVEVGQPRTICFLATGMGVELHQARTRFIAASPRLVRELLAAAQAPATPQASGEPSQAAEACQECKGTGWSRLYPNEQEGPCYRWAWVTRQISDRIASDGTKQACDACENCTALVMCDYHSLLSELDELRRVAYRAPSPALATEFRYDTCTACGVMRPCHAHPNDPGLGWPSPPQVAPARDAVLAEVIAEMTDAANPHPMLAVTGRGVSFNVLRSWRNRLASLLPPEGR